MWEKFHLLGPVILRMVVAVSFFSSAVSWSFLGPELSLSSFPMASLLRIVMFVISIFVLLGFFTEIAAFLALIVFTIATLVFHLYMFTYINYLAEIVVLLLLGSRHFSLDKMLFGSELRFKTLGWLEKYKTVIIRVGYGLSLVYAAISVKFMHAIVTLNVVNEYHLTKFHLLFPHDPLLVVLGGGLAEVAIALFIIFGFQLRITILVSLFT